MKILSLVILLALAACITPTPTASPAPPAPVPYIPPVQYPYPLPVTPVIPTEPAITPMPVSVGAPDIFGLSGWVLVTHERQELRICADPSRAVYWAGRDNLPATMVFMRIDRIETQPVGQNCTIFSSDYILPPGEWILHGLVTDAAGFDLHYLTTLDGDAAYMPSLHGYCNPTLRAGRLSTASLPRRLRWSGPRSSLAARSQRRSRQPRPGC